MISLASMLSSPDPMRRVKVSLKIQGALKGNESYLAMNLFAVMIIIISISHLSSFSRLYL
jgi:hypothetical protein